MRCLFVSLNNSPLSLINCQQDVSNGQSNLTCQEGAAGCESEETYREDLISEESDENFLNARKVASSGQETQASKMLQRGKRLLTELHIGQNATLRVPEFDRGPSDPRNLLVVILGKINDFYEVGCREGRLINKYTRADLDLVSETLLSPQEVSDAKLTLRTAVSKVTGGQGYAKCACKKSCDTSRCSCKKKSMMCNSKCHPGKACEIL